MPGNRRRNNNRRNNGQSAMSSAQPPTPSPSLSNSSTFTTSGENVTLADMKEETTLKQVLDKYTNQVFASSHACSQAWTQSHLYKLLNRYAQEDAHGNGGDGDMTKKRNITWRQAKILKTNSNQCIRQKLRAHFEFLQNHFLDGSRGRRGLGDSQQAAEIDEHTRASGNPNSGNNLDRVGGEEYLCDLCIQVTAGSKFLGFAEADYTEMAKMSKHLDECFPFSFDDTYFYTFCRWYKQIRDYGNIRSPDYRLVMHYDYFGGRLLNLGKLQRWLCPLINLPISEEYSKQLYDQLEQEHRRHEVLMTFAAACTQLRHLERKQRQKTNPPTKQQREKWRQKFVKIMASKSKSAEPRRHRTVNA